MSAVDVYSGIHPVESEIASIRSVMRRCEYTQFTSSTSVTEPSP